MSNNTLFLGIFIFLIILIVILIFNLILRKEDIKELEKKYNNLLSQNDVLLADQVKFQLQPHTIKNILGNLKAVSNQLYRGMNSLSDTLDYILYKGKNDLVSIKDEIEFIDKYLTLNEMFIHEIDAINIDKTQIDKGSIYYEKTCVPHLITANLLENAFKHGNTRHPEFLKVKVQLSENIFVLKVINKIEPKDNKHAGGIGLENMNKRLKLLKTGKFTVNQSCNEEEYHSILKIEFIE